MSVCAICASVIADGEALCSAHPLAPDLDWSVANRLMCDFIHRGRVPARVIEEHSEEELLEPQVCDLATV